MTKPDLKSRASGAVENALDCKWDMALDGLELSEKEQICRRLTRRQYAARSRIYTIGDKADSMLIVESGRMRWFYGNEAGEEFSMGIWPKGYTVGLISALLNEPRIVSVESVEPTVMLSLRRSDILELMGLSPKFAVNISRLAASIAAYSMDSTRPLALDTAAVRLCRMLGNLATRSEADQELVVSGLKQEDLASLIGVSRTWVTLTLSELERRGLIWRRRKQIGIFDLRSLQRFCDEESLRE